MVDNVDGQDTLGDIARDLPDRTGWAPRLHEGRGSRSPLLARVRHPKTEARGGPRGGGSSGGRSKA